MFSVRYGEIISARGRREKGGSHSGLKVPGLSVKNFAYQLIYYIVYASPSSHTESTAYLKEKMKDEG